MCRFAGALAVIGVLLCSSGAVAETTATDRRAIAALLLEVLHFRNPTTDVRIGGCRIVITTEYRRSGPKGPVIVSVIEIFTPSQELRINLSYRESEQAIWKPVIGKIRQSITVRRWP